jgi:hypothetical protein
LQQNGVKLRSFFKKGLTTVKDVVSEIRNFCCLQPFEPDWPFKGTLDYVLLQSEIDPVVAIQESQHTTQLNSQYDDLK